MKRRTPTSQDLWLIAPSGFTGADLLVLMAVSAVLAAVALPLMARANAKARLAVCKSNLQQITRAVQLYADEHQATFPTLINCPAPGAWWFYKDQVKAYVGLAGPSSPNEKVFACPKDRGYDETGDGPLPFWRSKKHNYTSYVFNGVNLPGVPNIAGWTVSSVREPAKTLSVMEWITHAPLSWHNSRTGRANAPFYNNAEGVVGFVDGHVDFIPIYYDGMNAAYTRDPIPGYKYKYSGD